MKAAWEVLRDAYAGWQRHQDSRLAAALAYYAVFSLAPLLLVLIAMLGLILGQSNAQQQVQSQIEQVVGRDGAQFINVLIAGANHHGTGTIALIVGGVLILYAAVGMFMALQNALDEVFEVRPENKGGFVRLVLLRLHGLIVIAALAIIALAALALANVVGGIMQTAIGGSFAGPLIEIGTAIINVVALTVFLAVVYRVLPQSSVSWKSAYVGAAITALILLVGEVVISLYFTKLHPAALYGAAAGIIILLLWIYYSAQLMLFGAEITRAYQARQQPASGPAAVHRGEVGQDARKGFPTSR